MACLAEALDVQFERGQAMVKVESSFITYRSAQGVTDTFFGRHEHCLVAQDGGLRIRILVAAAARADDPLLKRIEPRHHGGHLADFFRVAAAIPVKRDGHGPSRRSCAFHRTSEQIKASPSREVPLTVSRAAPSSGGGPRSGPVSVHA